MTSALLYKEFRETAGIAVLGAIALLAVAGSAMGWGVQIFAVRSGQIPFLSDNFQMVVALVAGLLALALGFKQSLGDFAGDSYLFLFHRPIGRGQIYGSKLVVGLALYLACSAVPILLYAWWASLAGTHASPFEWSMTASAWMAWLAITMVYLGAVLSGLRPAAWFGTRLAPLVGATLLALLTGMLPWWAGVPVILLIDAVLVFLILQVAQSRDYP